MEQNVGFTELGVYIFLRDFGVFYGSIVETLAEAIQHLE